MKLILLGAPGAGKGTQAEILSKLLNVPTISTGNILRAAIKNGTPVGLEAKSYIEAGQLVPDAVIIGIIRDRLAEPDCAGGYILDGVPRTIPQAEAMEAMGIDIDTALSIEVDRATAPVGRVVLYADLVVSEAVEGGEFGQARRQRRLGLGAQPLHLGGLFGRQGFSLAPASANNENHSVRVPGQIYCF